MQKSINIKSGILQIKSHHIWPELKDGIYIIELRSEKSKATHPMMAYLFGYVYREICKEMNGLVNKKEIDYLHGLLKETYGATHLVDSITHDIKEKKIIHRDEIKPKSLAIYTVQEMQDYWMCLQEMASTYFNILIRDPDPDWKKKWGNWEKKHQSKQTAITKKVIEVFDGVEI